MKLDRGPNRPVRHLEWRVRLLGIGAVLALAGMTLERGWLVNVALAVLVAGFVLRFVGRARDADESNGDDDPTPGATA